MFERHSEPYRVEGKTVGRVTNFVDITEFKQTEEKLVKYSNYYLIVADNGRGLPKDFTIEDNSKHSLGLSLVKTLTRQLKGELKVDNGNGATFTITFPAN